MRVWSTRRRKSKKYKTCPHQRVCGRAATVVLPSIFKLIPRPHRRKKFTVIRAHEGGSTFTWTSTCKQAFEQLKEYLSSVPLLFSPIEGETLFMYLAVTEAVVSSVLCSLWNEKMMPFYYVSHVPAGAEAWNSPLEKNIFTLVISARKLKPYIQAYPITALTTVHFLQIIQKHDLTRRMTKWV